ncbi:winged helix-turn-helix domain-containing protein [Streptococcus ictaluri]|uniref:Transcriptional regulatory protein, C-terminal domain protein n=1 Tax=Streptococcus ictaluri 707-05 TaxID=764299 RepID=G5JZE5_9STRE|nr:transcriptional regulatory protein, C-terminal domain protein [Streptococcus ictaluri 707-05]
MIIVSKPFSVKEVLLRIKIHLKRYGQANQKSSLQEETSEIIEVGPFRINTKSMSVWKHGVLVPLKAKEYKMFLFMAENSQQIISKERFSQEVWGEDYFGFDNTITVHIRRLREKLEDSPSHPKHILTVKGLGYKLMPGDTQK